MAWEVKAWILLAVASSNTYGAPIPVEMPLYPRPDYFANRNDDTRDLPILYDRYGTPPDHYPAIVPDIPMPDYDENVTYPGLYDEEDCHSVRNCPSEPDPSAPVFSDGLYFASQFTSDTGREWKCHVEADCFGLSAIPEDLSNDTEVLFLRTFNFTTLSVGDLGVLPPLLKLRIEYTDLATIEPGVFGDQPTLQYLEIVGNPITTFAPGTFLELVDLTSLEITSNNISFISRRVFRGLDEVKDLKIINNKITWIFDDTFREMPKLEFLNLEENRIASISRYAFRGLRNLSTLHLNHNEISAVPSLALRELPALNNLYMTGNPIGTISKYDFRGLDTLQKLSLDHCELTSIAKRTFQGKRITFLGLSENKLTVVPNLGTMKKLKTVLMDLNPWHCDCEMIRTVKWLKRHSLGSASENPVCFTPMHLKGRRALNVTYEELCAPPPPFIPTPDFTQSTESYFTSLVMTPAPYDEDETVPEDDMKLPEGGWSTGVYDPRDFFTIKNEEMLTHNTTTPGVTTGSRDTELKTSTTIPLDSEERGSAVDAASEISTYADYGTTGQPHPHPKTPDIPTHIVPPPAGSKFYVAVIAVVGFIILIIVLIAVIFKVLIAQRATERVKKQRARQIELQNANEGAPEVKDETKSQPNQNDSPKADENSNEGNVTEKAKGTEVKSLDGDDTEGAPNEEAPKEEVDKDPVANGTSEETKTPDAKEPDTSQEVNAEEDESAENEEKLKDEEETSEEKEKEKIDETGKEDDKPEAEET